MLDEHLWGSGEVQTIYRLAAWLDPEAYGQLVRVYGMKKVAPYDFETPARKFIERA